MITQKKCSHIECSEESAFGTNFCKFHYYGGVIGNGETYEQYQVIEKDFIDFIKIIPLTEKKNLDVYSPVLRDIIIRSCVQIELFFKEWAKYECSFNQENNLFKKYQEIDRRTQLSKGAKNWNFVDYFLLKEKYLTKKMIHVRDLNINCDVFDDWKEEKSIPEWWKAYNAIKHDGINSKTRVTLKNALDSLLALFSLHCNNRYSRNYLEEFSQVNISKSFDKLNVKLNLITTPLDTKKYLFKDVYSSRGSGISIEKSSEHKDRLNLKSKRI
jgi:hypothetical protein